MTDLLHFWCSLLIVLVQQAHLNYSENVAEVDLSLTQMSQIMIKLDQFLSTKYKIENKMPKTEEEKIANLKELQLESIRHFFDFDNENEFMPIILYNLVESLPKLGKSAANSPNFDLNSELAQLTLEQNLLVLEGLFDFGWFNGSKLVYGLENKEFLKTKARAERRLIDWHFYEELEKKFWQVRNIIRRLLSNDMRSTLFQKWNPTQIKVNLRWFGDSENIEKWMLCESHQNGIAIVMEKTESSSSSLINEEMDKNNGKRRRKEQNSKKAKKNL